MAISRARLATLLSHSLKKAGWAPHQHRLSIFRWEPDSSPLPDWSPSPADWRRVRQIQSLVDTHCDRPAPALDLPFYPWPSSPGGATKLDWTSDERPAEASFTWSTELSEESAADLWRQVVVEVAAGWASTNRAGKSAGRLFLGPKARLIFWPRLVNLHLREVGCSMGRVVDLFTTLAACGVKLDLKSAYRSISLDTDDALYQAAILDGTWIVFDRLSFGMAQSPVIFVTFLALTLRRYRDSMPGTLATLTALAQYMDDSGIGATSPSAALDAVYHLIVALTSDGWWVSAAKTFVYIQRRSYSTSDSSPTSRRR